ncbi:SusC/RagA family TonB-linked outer membrane protein [Spirosoma utsteinense]|uniref:TonB-linked SusC/RagA family outer membrane protein n=1 Tax=Spirosoma utsteinense TaxID=2585773 RepID=A0ABR6W930_9BACT|nr:TonB-dependent receptor [Spirosoma utsteinense]MBC3786136.1 TonB-linked SusC/RagA family outer membrane protein [Spirosoma utsteinense]MBC3792325.1 TonB-linked SusC/RagA family outer membrane protein [Spirosoma utsteinense]
MRNHYNTVIFGVFFILLSGGLLAQGLRISGRITSVSDGQALPGVNVLVKGTTNGVSTDANGNYSLTIPNGSVTLLLTSIGIVTQEVAVGNRTVINVQMVEAINELSQVVVTGYNTTQRKDITGSITSVSPEKFKNIPITSFDQALQGQAAGVQVTQSSGTPGGGINVRVRGSTSISASNRPLFVVDGVPVEDGQLTNREFGGQQDNAFALFNPNDIESIDVLKDASAKAIYGSRAANGVVLITTKKGRSGQKTTFSADVQRGMIDMVRRPDLLNASELLELQREAVTNAGQDPDKQGLVRGVTDGVDTDWVKATTRRAIYQQYQLSSQGGNDKTQFYLSGSYRNEEGVQLNNEFGRYTGQFKFDHKATSQLSFGTNITLSRAKNKRVKGDNFLDGVYSGAVKSLPYYSPYDEFGRLYGPNDDNYAGFPNFNPVGQAVLPRFETYTAKLLGGLYAEYEFIPNLRLRSKISIDYNNVTEDNFEPSTTAIGGFLTSVGGQGYGDFSNSTFSTLINTSTLTYNFRLASKHKFNTMAGFEALQRQQRSGNLQGRLFPSDDFTYIRSAGIVDQGDSYRVNSGLISTFGEVRYDYDEKYLATITARYDGSSRFGQDKQFGIFPSASLAWRISSEPFMQRFRFLSDLKLRTSFGFTGNERIGDFQFLGTWASTTYSGSTGVGPRALTNPQLQWERTREANVGLDASLFSGRLNVTVDAYSNLTDKLLFAQPIPQTTGFSTVQGNIGKVSNKGIELTISTVNIDRGGVRWSTDLNLSRNDNKVVELVSSEPIFRGYTANGVSNTNVILPGQPLGTFWGLKFLGVDPATGNAIYDDKNGDGRITPDDGQVIGNAQPKLFGGFTNRVTWKGFELSGFFQFSYGNSIMNLTNQTLLNSGADLENNQSRKALQRWRKEGDITSVPKYVSKSTYNNFLSSRYVEDGSYVRLKNVSLGYNLPKQWITRYKLSNLRVYASGTNLWTLTQYSGPDPEVSTLDGSTTAQGIDFFTFPQVKTVIVGLSVNF